MAEARRRDEWSRVSSMMALQANLQAGRRRTYRPDEFDPFGARRVPIRGSIDAVINAFCGPEKARGEKPAA